MFNIGEKDNDAQPTSHRGMDEIWPAYQVRLWLSCKRKLVKEYLPLG